MSEINTNGFSEALQKQKDVDNANKILKKAKDREDQWWRLYKIGLVKYE